MKAEGESTLASERETELGLLDTGNDVGHTLLRGNAGFSGFFFFCPSVHITLACTREH